MATEVSIDNLNEWLINQPENTKDSPYEITITGLTSSNYTGIKNILKENLKKYVDLSSTFLPNDIIFLDGLFEGCSNLVRSPVLPSEATSLYRTFYNCTSLVTAPVIPNFVNQMDFAFYNCTSLVSVPLVRGDTVEAFYNCISLKRIDVCKISATGLDTSMHRNMFYNCKSLESIGYVIEESDNWHVFRLKIGNNSIEGKIFDKNKNETLIQSTSIVKSSLVFLIFSDELLFTSDISDSDLDALIKDVIDYKYTYTGESTRVINPKHKSFVLWAENEDTVVTNLSFPADVSHAVGVLPVANGGTGQTSLADVSVGHASDATNGVYGRLGGAKGSAATNFTDLIAEVSSSSGGGGICGGSINTTAANKGVPAGWYNFLYIPHRTGTGGGDNYKYGTLYLSPMTSDSNTLYVIHHTNGTVNNAQVYSNSSIKDSNNGTLTTFAYSKSGLTGNPSWLAAWNGYELRAIAPDQITSGACSGNAATALRVKDSSNSSSISITSSLAATVDKIAVWNGTNIAAAYGKDITAGYLTGIGIDNIRIGSSQAKITLSQLMTWLMTTKSYIPAGVACYRVLGVPWDYAGNDILQLSANGVNYELQLAGCLIEFMGSATNYNTGRFRLIIHSSPANSFTVSTNYEKFPVSTAVTYTCNGSNYTPVWKIDMPIKKANGFWGLQTPKSDGTWIDSDWIRTTTQGIIPYQSGGASAGHCSLGTSSWYFASAYIQNIYGSLTGTATDADKVDGYHVSTSAITTQNNSLNSLVPIAKHYALDSSSVKGGYIVFSNKLMICWGCHFNSGGNVGQTVNYTTESGGCPSFASATNYIVNATFYNTESGTYYYATNIKSKSTTSFIITSHSDFNSNTKFYWCAIGYVS